MRQTPTWLSLGILIGVAGLAPPLAGTTQSQARYLDQPMTVRYDVGLRMRDGVRLSADIYRPVDEGRHPTIFELTPYNNNNDGAIERAWHDVARGYAVVLVDVRGRYDSDGTFYPWRHDGADGSDVIDWIARQTWSDGRVATRGGSYLGHNQWLIAKERNPHHVAIVSYVAPADGFHDEARWDGVPKIDLIYTWSMGMYGRVNQSRAGWNWPKAMWHLPLHTMDEAVGRRFPAWRDWMEHDRLDQYWDPVQVSGSYDTFDIPSFNVTGWWDGQLRGQTQHYVETVRTASDPSDHMLVIGPWLHGVNRTRRIGERDFGPTAIIDLDGIRDQWLDHRMLNTDRPDLPNVKYFLQGRNDWREAAAWPPPGTQATAFYLSSGGNANTLLGDGRLGPTPTDGPPDAYTYDPANPVPTVSSRTAGARGGILQGSVDNRAVETRNDVLVYTSDPLPDGIEVTGPVEAVVFLSTDVPDTDIAVKLLEVSPDGRALNVSHGIARARYRDSFSSPSPLEPDRVYELRVKMYPTSTYFAPGQRIRIEVTSSNFPQFGRNLNTGASSDTTTAMRRATIQIHHDGNRPSRIVLPIVSRTAAMRRP